MGGSRWMRLENRWPARGLLLSVAMLHLLSSLVGCGWELAPLFETGAADAVGPSLSGRTPGEALVPEHKTGTPLQESDLRRGDGSLRRGSFDRQLPIDCSLRQRIRLVSFFQEALHSSGRMPGMPGARLLYHRKSGGSEEEECPQSPA